MGSVYFTSNPAEYSRLPGLYITERLPAGFIRGVNLGTVGMAGRCVRGPTAPQVITSAGRFLEIFGGRDYGSGGAVIGEIWQAMLNKPFGRLVVRRVVAEDATVASFTFESAAGGAGDELLKVAASSPGAWGNGVRVKISDATDGNAQHFNITIDYLGKRELYENADISGANDNLAALVGSDVARFVDLTKLAAGRPVNTAPGVDGADADGFVSLGTVQAGYASTAGSEGTVAVGDYNDGIDDLATYPGIAIVLAPAAVPTPATFHSNMVLRAAAATDRVFLTWSQVHGQDTATEIAQVAAQITTRTDRIVWCFNSAFTIDPETDAEVQTAPHVWLASILSQIDVDIHAGEDSTIAYLAGITRLATVALEREDLIALQEAGISTLERVEDGFQFRSVVTTDLTEGRTELARRRGADFLLNSAAGRLRHYVKKRNTPTIRRLAGGELIAFSDELRDAERVVEDFEVNTDSVNTDEQRGRGQEFIEWRVRMIGHILALVIVADIGTGTIIERR